MDSSVEEIKSRLNIVDVLGEYIRLDKAGANFRAACPFHNEKTPSFMVSEEKQIWHCFGCGKGGDIFGFVMEMEGLEFKDALKLLAEKAGVQLKSYNPKKTEEKNRTLEILELVTKFYEVQLWKGDGKVKILKYLWDRGLRDEIIKEFRLGYAPRGWRNLLAFLTKRGYKIEEIAKTGLLVEKTSEVKTQESRYYDRFRDRIIFPIADYSGKIVGYSARVAPGGDESQAKYVNTPETEVYHKSRILYGIDKARSDTKQKNWIMLVEGNMDVIAASQAGIKNTVAVSGTALTQDQVKIIKRYTPNVKMFFDMDSAGEIATKKSVKLCLASDMSVKVVSLPKGKDAADVARENPKNLIQAIKNSLGVMEHFFERTFSKFDKSQVADKKKITEELLDIIASVENSVEKNYWIKKLAEKLEVAETALTDMLKKISLKSRIESKKEIGSDEESSSTSELSKLEILSRELIGLMLVSKEIWQVAEEEIAGKGSLIKDELFNWMFGKGKGLDYNFDALVGKLNNDQELRTKAEQVFFEKKYQLDLNNNLVETILDDPLKDFRTCLKEIKKEVKKEKLVRLASDLKIAETKKDEPNVIFLRQEFNKISKELAELIN